MKIVINRCFGGFGLSREALEYLSKKGVKTYDSWKALQDDKHSGIWILLNKDESYSNYQEFRTDSNLIEVINHLQEKANGMCARLDIVDIPDDIEYQINEYDGNESIHERHRSW